MEKIKKILKDIHRFLERRFGGTLLWAIYGVATAILFRLFVLGQKPGDMLADLLILIFSISLIVAAFKILQLRLRKPPRR